MVPPCLRHQAPGRRVMRVAAGARDHGQTGKELTMARALAYYLFLLVALTFYGGQV